MSNVWIVPADGPTTDDRCDDGDYLLRADGDAVQIWHVDAGDTEWIAEIPSDQLPDDVRGRLDTDERIRLDEPRDALVALHGITEAVRSRGA